MLAAESNDKRRFELLIHRLYEMDEEPRNASWLYEMLSKGN